MRRSLINCGPLRRSLLPQRRHRGLLTVASAHGTARVLRPEALHFSPALGLVAFNSPTLCGNLLRCGGAGLAAWGVDRSAALARELFFQPTRRDPLRATTSRSMAAAHATPLVLGHLLGLATSGASRARVEETLAGLGIRSNRVGGEWTGVSLARWCGSAWWKA